MTSDTSSSPSPADLQKAEEWKEKGNAAFRVKNLSEALNFYSKGISIAPTAQLLSNRAATYLSLKRLPLALQDAKKAVQVAPQWAKAHRRKASVLDAMKRYQEAKLAYEQALKVIPVDETLDEEGRRKDEAEVQNMIESLYVRINAKEGRFQTRLEIPREVPQMPGVRILQEAERRMAEGEPIGVWPPIGTCARRLWIAEMQFHNALVHLFEFHTRPMPGATSGPPAIAGRLQTLEELTTALIEDPRVARFDNDFMDKLQLCMRLEQQARNALGPDLSPSETIFVYNERLQEGPKDAQPIMIAPGKPQPGPRPVGWDYVRPALQLSIRSALMNGLLLSTVGGEELEEAIVQLRRANDLIEEARKEWAHVDGSLRGRTLETTFLRQIKVNLGETLLAYYNHHHLDMSMEQRRKVLDEILAIGHWIVESVKAEPRPPKEAIHMQQPGEMAWWGTYYTHYAAPMGFGYSFIGFAHARYGVEIEYTDFTAASGQPGPRAANPMRMGKACYAYTRAAAWMPVDEPRRCNALWMAVFCMVRRGGYFLADFEVLREMATNCAEHYSHFFPEAIIDDTHIGRAVSSEVVGTVVGMTPNQICSPMVEWMDGVEMDMEIAAEVLEPWTKSIVSGKEEGMLAATDVIKKVWKEREEAGESREAIGSDVVWNEMQGGQVENWEEVWEEHLDQGMRTFKDEEYAIGHESDDGSESQSDLEFTRSVVGA